MGCPPTVSARFDEYLEDTYVAEPSARYRIERAPTRERCSSIAAPGSRYFSARDQHHGEADALLRAAGVGRGSLTTNLVLAEVHRWLLFQAGIAPRQAALDRIDATPLVQDRLRQPEHHRRARAWLAKLATAHHVHGRRELRRDGGLALQRGIDLRP